MSEPRFALGGARFNGLIAIEELPPQGMITLRGDFADVALKNAATGVSGQDFPRRRQAGCQGERGILWMSPDELAVLLPHAEAPGAVASMARTLQGKHALAVDVSDARVHFRLGGPALREVIAKLAPLDMDPAVFPPGELRRTRFGQVAAGIWLRDETTAQVFCFRSVAQYLFDLLSAAARPGSEIGLFRAS